MQFENWVFWIYIVLLLVGGLIGFFKAKSKISLITSVVAAALLILTTFRGIFQASFANDLANIILLLLLIAFTIRLAKTKKFMPAGLMLVATIIVLLVRNIRF